MLLYHSTVPLPVCLPACVCRFLTVDFRLRRIPTDAADAKFKARVDMDGIWEQRYNMKRGNEGI